MLSISETKWKGRAMLLSTSDTKIKNFRATEVEKDSFGKVWALWGVNIFNKRNQMWCVPELEAYNCKEDISATISLLVSEEKCVRNH